LGVCEYLPTIDCSVACDDCITFETLFFEPEIGGSVGYEGIEFGEAAIVEKADESFSCSEFSTFVLRFNSLLAAAKVCLFAASVEIV
jgi:hypothetical protein